MRLSDLQLKPGDRVIEIKQVMVVRQDGTTQTLSVTEDITPVPVEKPAVEQITQPVVKDVPVRTEPDTETIPAVVVEKQKSVVRPKTRKKV